MAPRTFTTPRRQTTKQTKTTRTLDSQQPCQTHGGHPRPYPLRTGIALLWQVRPLTCPLPHVSCLPLRLEHQPCSPSPNTRHLLHSPRPLRHRHPPRPRIPLPLSNHSLAPSARLHHHTPPMLPRTAGRPPSSVHSSQDNNHNNRSNSSKGAGPLSSARWKACKPHSQRFMSASRGWRACWDLGRAAPERRARPFLPSTGAGSPRRIRGTTERAGRTGTPTTWARGRSCYAPWCA